MSVRRSLLSAAAPALLLVLASCADRPFRADVTRFQMMPPPQGQTFTVQAADPALQGGIEFSNYAGLVAGRLAQQGYQPVAPGARATLVVTLDYGVDNGHEKVVTTPGFGYGGFGYGGYGGGWGGPFGYGGFGRGFYGRGWYGGWGAPWGPFDYPSVDSYTYYVSHLTMQVRRATDGRVLFEGKARARSVDDSLPHLVPNLVEAMFVGFPGRSGEDVQITIPPPPKPGATINRRG